ncbi:hypothetical protein [Wolbachia endosymbiont of Litomosoides sigmodontis]|nr:hypothetical protein [Wolbachia endosymbiont of Litomosoides sigmodontis]
MSESRIRANDGQLVENVKVTNDHTFYKLIYEKKSSQRFFSEAV